ncbi:C2H2 type zinc finger domain protein [Aspergillus clavatus NRRL 1]|uniref:C2H2 type zinc finger domain protein n=1 Tax=Aspergillus clavatus (strain ATCC 1007 / CBS 513.65 / DSM 816 / NCTC 3887 / NRRL 1 / QM 1276 / 107) TaxID=344612 RepID=A1CBM3_ASPCL|nr:C2H2 type zinc finger domain protein [Aspergillus clavatus NRRL 1]EAW13141.1 C2H2 type zinc finger domain protein [Aspergillus clavatus NRRL 1]
MNRTTNPTSATKALFHCPHPGCGRSYQRKEHLTRHFASHGQAPACECPFCDKVFSRNDTLRQHVRIHHKDKELKSTRTIRACSHCRARRSRCDGRVPCKACTQRGIQCSLGQSSAAAAHAHQGTGTPRDSRTDLTVSDSQDEQPGPSDRSITPEQRAEGPLLVRKAAILHYVEVYFERFHPVWPFLHRATFDPDLEPPILLQSVIMMGLWMAGEEDTQCKALKLHEKLSLLVYQQRDNWAGSDLNYENPPPWPMATYQGILLQIIFALIKDNETQLDIQLTRPLCRGSSRLLTTLIDTCRRQNLFFYPAILAQFSRESVPDVFIWVGIEEVKRFALALYKVCRLCHVQDTELDTPRSTGRGKDLLALMDLQFALPDSDELWHASSDLAARLAQDGPMCYSNKNIEANWISQAARLLQKQGLAFDWL